MMDTPKPAPQGLLALLEPAVYITIIASSLYFAGWNFEENYFARFSLPFSYLTFDVPHYLVRGVPTTLAAVVIMLFSVLGVGQPPYSISRSIAGNAILFVLAAIFILRGLEPPFYYRLDDNPAKAGLFMTLGVLLFLLLLVSSARRQSLARYFWESSHERRIGILLLTVFVAGLLGEVHANMKAAYLLSGKSKGAYIELVSKEGSAARSQIDHRRLLLVRHHDDQYFVLDAANGPGSKSHLMVIPQDEIAVVKVLYQGVRLAR